MRTVLVAAEMVGAALLMLALAAPPACGQSLGELSAAQGIHGTLARQGTSSGRGTRDVVNRSLAKSTKPRKELGLGSGSSKPRRPTSSRAKSAGSRGSSGRGSWVTAGGNGRASSSSWLQGGAGWGSGGRSQGKRRPRS